MTCQELFNVLGCKQITQGDIEMKLPSYETLRKAQRIRRKRIEDLLTSGMTAADVARKEGVTPQRVGQIAKEMREAK